MAFGKGSNTPSNKTLFTFKIKTKDLPVPIFEVTKKEGDKYVVLPDEVNAVSGNIVRIESKPFTYIVKTTNKKKTSLGATLTLEDKDDLYFVNLNYDNLGRSIMNALLNLKKFENINISLYRSKAKEANGPTYPSAAVRVDDEMAGYAFKQEELPPVDKINLPNGEVFKDTTKRDEFFHKHLNDFNNVIQAARNGKAPTVQVPLVPTAAPAKDDDGPLF
jgi:hypothetical protein